MKKKAIVGLILATTLSTVPSIVNAEGFASINFKSQNQVQLGENIKVYLSIEDIVDDFSGIVSVGGKLKYDSDKLELIEAKELDVPYTFWFNQESNKLAGLDFTFENELKKDTNLYEFTFKAIEEGATEVTLTEAELADKKERLVSNVYGKKILVVAKNKTQETIEKVEEKIENDKSSVETLEKKIDILEKTIENLQKENKKYNATITKIKKQESKKETIMKLSNKVKSFIKAIKDLF